MAKTSTQQSFLMQRHSTAGSPWCTQHPGHNTHQHQVLVDKDPSVSSDHLKDLNEHELVAKINKALMSMASQCVQGLKVVKAVGNFGYLW